MCAKLVVSICCRNTYGLFGELNVQCLLFVFVGLLICYCCFAVVGWSFCWLVLTLFVDIIYTQYDLSEIIYTRYIQNHRRMRVVLNNGTFSVLDS